MITGSKLSLAAILLSFALGLTSIVAATPQSGEIVFDNSEVVPAQPQVRSFNEIVSLRLRINARDEVKLLAKRIVSGAWDDTRRIPVGTRFYYEVVDNSGNVVAKGFRRDPRGMSGRNVDFLLTAPYNLDCAYVNLYEVNYENGGRDGYSRDYSLLGTFDIRQKQTARLN
jgi:hypothetical protein